MKEEDCNGTQDSNKQHDLRENLRTDKVGKIFMKQRSSASLRVFISAEPSVGAILNRGKLDSYPYLHILSCGICLMEWPPRQG